MKKIIFISFIALLFIACEKEENIGCTDPNAINYDPSATSIPGSDLANCVYDTTCSAVIPNVDFNNYPMDSYIIDTAYINQSILYVNVNYAGGCETHNFELIHEFLFCGTPPVHLQFRLSHDSNNESCEALLIETLCFDISSVYDLCDSSCLFLSLYDPENNNSINFY